MFELFTYLDRKTSNLFHKYVQPPRVLMSEKVLFLTFPHISFAVLLNKYSSYTNNILKFYSSNLLEIATQKKVTRILCYQKQESKVVPALPFERTVLLHKLIH